MTRLKNVEIAWRFAVLLSGALPALRTTAQQAESQTLVSPHQYASEFVPGPGISPIERYIQEQFSHEEFQSANGDILAISGLALRLDENKEFDVDTTLSSMQIMMATAAKPLWQMSAAPEANWGPDKTTVYDQHNVRLIAEAGQPAGAFDLAFSFAKPFYYDRRAGDLVVQILPGNTGSGNNFGADFIGDLPDLKENRYNSGNSEAPYGGFVVQFTYSVVPEPEMLGVLAIGLLLFANLRNNRSRNAP